MRGLDVLDTTQLSRLVVLVVRVSCLLEVGKYAGEGLVFTDQRKREVRGNRTLQSTARGIALKRRKRRATAPGPYS